MNPYLERALFVVAPKDSGKSTQLRSMFLDRRMGTDGVVPTSANLAETYHLSNERRLHLRLTSPHEYGEAPKEFVDKTCSKMDGGRWCFAGALQPGAANKMPDVVESVRYFQNAFDPERLRIVFLSPNRHGAALASFSDGRDLISELHALRVEVVCVDARSRRANGLLLADFFDFT